MKYMISYGSNMNTRQMGYRCKDAEVVGKGFLRDYVLVFRGSAGNAHATIIPQEDGRLPIVMWRISEKDEAQLDIYEGVSGGYYSKEYIRCTMPDGSGNEALVYIMNENARYNKPNPHYVDCIADGYMEFGFDTDWLDLSVSESNKMMLLQRESCPKRG